MSARTNLYKCPHCRTQFRPSEITVEPDKGGGFHCPRCAAMLQFSERFRTATKALSFVIAFSFLFFLEGVRNVLALILGTPVLAFVVCLLIQSLYREVRLPGIELWKPKVRRPYNTADPYKTSFDLFGKRK